MIVTIVKCDKCGKIEHFDGTLAEAKKFYKEHGWKVGEQDFCIECKEREDV